jgi:hypothetical protein
MSRSLYVVLSIFLSSQVVAAYNSNNAPVVSRRDWMNGLVVVAGAVTASVNVPETANAVISSKYCAYGTGDGCDDLAEGNEFIRELQARSAVNKEAIQLVRTVGEYWYTNY